MSTPKTAASRYINFYTDFAFKKIFGTEANKDFLISFLNALLGLEGEKEIIDVSYLEAEQLGNGEKREVYGVYCQTKEEDRFILEMQKAKQDNFRDSALYFSSFAIREQGYRDMLGRLSWNNKLSPVCVVRIFDFLMDESSGSDNVITQVCLKDENNKVFNDKLKFIFVEMPKFNKEESELESFLDKWFYIFKNMCHLQDKPASFTEDVFKKLFETAEVAALSKEELQEYEESLKKI